MSMNTINADSQYMGIKFFEFIISYAELFYLCRTDKCKIPRIKEKDNPFPCKVLKIYITDLSFKNSLHLEIRRFLANLCTHFTHLSCIHEKVRFQHPDRQSSLQLALHALLLAIYSSEVPSL